MSLLLLADRNKNIPQWAAHKLDRGKFIRNEHELPRYAKIEKVFSVHARRIVGDFAGGRISRGDAMKQFRERLNEAETHAFISGKRASGSKTIFITPAESKMLNGRHSRNMRYFSRFLSDIENERTRMPIMRRANMYAKSLWSLYNRGQGGIDWTDPDPDARYMWVLDWDAEHCFPAGTMVSTPRGDVPIQEVAVGDEVITRFGVKRVTKTYKSRHTKNLNRIEVNGRIVYCTDGHPFWTDSGWKKALDLSPNDVLMLFDDTLDGIKAHVGLPSTPDRAEPFDATIPAGFTLHHCSVTHDVCYPGFDGYVYNIEVEDCHEYIANGIVVHNCDDCLKKYKDCIKKGGYTFDELIEIGFPGEGCRCCTHCRCYIEKMSRRKKKPDDAPGVLLRKLLEGDNDPVSISVAGLPRAYVEPAQIAETLHALGSTTKAGAFLGKLPEALTLTLLRPMSIEHIGEDAKLYKGYDGSEIRLNRGPNGLWYVAWLDLGVANAVNKS